MKVLFSFLFLCVLHAEIIELKNIDALSSQILSNSLIVFDIDNTIIQPKQPLGSNQWFLHRWKEYDKQNPKTALEKALNEWDGIQYLTSVKPVENETKKVVEELQKKKFKVIALTTRDFYVSRSTLRQLEDTNIDFSNAAPFKEEFFFKVADRFLQYKNGIIFSYGLNKGEVLFTFLNLIKYSPSRIIFIDDSFKVLKEVEAACLKRKIPFMGFYYTFTHSQISQNDLIKASKKMNCINKFFKK